MPHHRLCQRWSPFIRSDLSFQLTACEVARATSPNNRSALLAIVLSVTKCSVECTLEEGGAVSADSFIRFISAVKPD